MFHPFPLVIRASFLFSGMFGIRLEGLKGNDGRPITMESSVPLNFTVPASVMESTRRPDAPWGVPGIFPPPPPPIFPFKEPFPNPIPDRSNNQRCFGGCKENSYGNNGKPIIGAIGGEENLLQPANGENGILFLPNEASKTKPCGPGNCTADQLCVSWSKQANYKRRESPMMIHECLPNDGLHWNKMNPSGGKLCENGKTHSISKESQKCLREKPPCDLHWKYTCVEEKDSPHNCRLKKCLNDACIEIVHCGLEPPCYLESNCILESA